MEKIKDIAAGLLASGEVQVVLGYGEGPEGSGVGGGAVRPLFVTDAAQAAEMVYDDRCRTNLAMYLYKRELAPMGKPAIIGGVQTMRSVMRLAAERQLRDGSVVAVAVDSTGTATICRTLDDLEAWLASSAPALSAEDARLMAELEAMTPAKRYRFWQAELEHCTKCYACRQACPLCYCTQCTVEINQPQWITVEANSLGGAEWHMMRAMHLAGRCVECGECGRACPSGIPIHLLTMKMAKDVREHYGAVTGMKRDEGCAMSTFAPDDKENFIG